MKHRYSLITTFAIVFISLISKPYTMVTNVESAFDRSRASILKPNVTD